MGFAGAGWCWLGSVVVVEAVGGVDEEGYGDDGDGGGEGGEVNPGGV